VEPAILEKQIEEAEEVKRREERVPVAERFLRTG
jgi:hypothetical protein